MAQRRCLGCMNLTENLLCEHCGTSAGEDNPRHALPRGTVLAGKYVIGKVLGQGGFGITYLGWDIAQRRKVCLKEYYPSSMVNRDCSQQIWLSCNTQDQEAKYVSGRERFLREASSLSLFREVKQIVTIFDLFQDNNTAYMVMEYIKGVELQKYVERVGPLTLDQTLRIMKPVMEALVHVHKAGIVHRDVAPDNIMLHNVEGAKLLDFGSVRNVENPGVEKELTHSTEAILKNGYAPMEQYMTRGSLGPWTDVYSVCATIYFCMTGESLEYAPSRMMNETDPDISKLPGLSRRQRAAMEHGLALHPRDRIGSMEELLQELCELPVRVPQSTAGKKEKRQKKKLVIGLVCAALVLAAGIVSTLLLLPWKSDDSDASLRDNKSQKQQEETRAEEKNGDSEQETIQPTVVSGEIWEENVMILDPISAIASDRSGIVNVYFCETIKGAPSDAVDLSDRGNGSVVGWMEGDTLYFAAEGGINGEKCCPELFRDCYELTQVQFGSAFHTDYAESMRGMFYGCISLTVIDASNLRTDNVRDMSEMFFLWRDVDSDGYWTDAEVGKLEQLDVSNWNVSNVRDMSKMFRYCNKLQTLDVSRWDVSSVENFSEMFGCCSSIDGLDVSNWNVSAVTTMSRMFTGCPGLGYIAVENWDVSGVHDVSLMFLNCTNVQLDISKWNLPADVNWERFMSDGATIGGKPWEEWFQ